MLVTHQGKSPRVHPTAYVAPNAAVCGDVVVGPGCRILLGAQIIAEGGSIEIGAECIVMENAVLRSNTRHSLTVGNNCLVGPNAHVVGCMWTDRVSIGALESSPLYRETVARFQATGVLREPQMVELFEVTGGTVSVLGLAAELSRAPSDAIDRTRS